jgi:hypothetical protein
MNLQEFVAESLSQIILGVKQAQSSVASTGAQVAPLMRTTIDKDSIGQAEGNAGQPVYTVDFDIAVMATEGKGTKGGIGVVVGSIGLGSQGQSESKNSHESRIRFKVPLLLPPQQSS